MNSSFNEARLAVDKAREALRNNDRSQARQWAERAAALAPQMEDPWLLLAAIASPRASLEYIQRALKINPNSPRARRGMEWAMQRLRDPARVLREPQSTSADPKKAPISKAEVAAPPIAPAAKRPANKRSPRYAILLVALGCIVCAAAAWSATKSPVVASIIQNPAEASEPTHPASWAQASIPKPTYTPAALSGLEEQLQPTATVEFIPTATADDSGANSLISTPTIENPTQAEQPMQMAEVLPTETFIPTAEPTWSGSLSMSYVDDTPTSESELATSAPALTSAAPPPGVVAKAGQHWIDVNLTQQMVYAYEGNNVTNSFLVSTGTWMTPTVTGQYHVYVKLRSTDMSGDDYYLPDVPYTMYFYKGYGLHGTYWHHNFGTPMSHGCVNLSIPDAEWLYNFASVGTLVNVHY